MLEDKFKSIYVDLETGKWYITTELNDSHLKALRVEVNVPAESWYVKHYRKTTKLFCQVLDDYNTEIIPQAIKLIDNNSIQIDFGSPTSGILHLIFTGDEFYDIIPSPTPPVTPTITPTITPTVSG